MNKIIEAYKWSVVARPFYHLHQIKADTPGDDIRTYVIPMIVLLIFFIEQHIIQADVNFLLTLTQLKQQLEISHGSGDYTVPNTIIRYSRLLSSPEIQTQVREAADMESKIKIILTHALEYELSKKQRQKQYVALERMTSQSNIFDLPDQWKQICRRYHRTAQQQIQWRTQQYKLSAASEWLRLYSEKLQEKCGYSYSFDIQFDYESDTQLHGVPHTNNIILCIYDNKKCISSVLIIPEKTDRTQVRISPMTTQERRRRGFGKLLISLCIMILPLLSTKIVSAHIPPTDFTRTFPFAQQSQDKIIIPINDYTRKEMSKLFDHHLRILRCRQ